MPAPRKKTNGIGLPAAEILADYRVACMSRFVSLTGRKEVLSGKAKFGIFGGGKEVAQVALARTFRHGDWRAGYYRDQTWMFASGITDIKKFFAQLYADTNHEREPASGGRQMNAHFASRYLDKQGNWLNQLMMHNTTADASPTACQMPRLLGLGYASKLYRENQDLQDLARFSINGNEVAFGTIGNASTSEGLFWECLNAAGVLQVPLVISVWDDEYGISVPAKYQTVKESISKVVEGFRAEKGALGMDIHVVRGWDYPSLVETYYQAVDKARKHHIPSLVHVTELTQPQGHSTSGSHERYKSKERLEFEVKMDCLKKMREWLVDEGLATTGELDELEEEAKTEVDRLREEAWQAYLKPLQDEREELLGLLDKLTNELPADSAAEIRRYMEELRDIPTLNRRAVLSTGRRVLQDIRDHDVGKNALIEFTKDYHHKNNIRYSSCLLNETDHSTLKVEGIEPVYGENPEEVDGRQVIQKIFDHHLQRDPRIFVIGEDVGRLGGVNLEFEGLHDKFGELRVTDTGIREATILGQGIGAAVRGLRPVVDIQYLDYLLYAFQTMSDDLATLHYRTSGGQAAPVIVRTKGDRLEGVWHTGSPMGTVIHGLRGCHVCVPRNMVQAAGMYNTLFQGDDPALIVEVLNGYRRKEKLPDNLTEFCIPLGVPEVLEEGDDITLVTYGACVNIAREAIALLSKAGATVELIDVRTLLPFDLQGIIGRSIEKTGAVLFCDEDVPGGASSYMMQQVLEKQGAYRYLDAAPRTLSSMPHRGAYGTDGDYFSKPNADDMFDYIYAILREREPDRFPPIR